ncbi:dihydroxyacetone phosphate acyltransferase isoform X2 [Corythoichthys intestinalis]|uniref:dihydroxyacetone phosphate acyltransferase isoform X2 n=1 Tax=Corythoichthys intestinalis TaxID=161448 RepID=UPI0025A63BE5|nr:dihydroxyacetone phosphate acyltransferase isoform X2 [Corythoichthys intestinalis]
MAKARRKYVPLSPEEVDDDEEDTVDVLEERRRSSDVAHALRTFTPRPDFPAGQLDAAVLASRRVRRAMDEVAAETGSPPSAVRERVDAILREMSQNLRLPFVRAMGFVLSKVLKRLFSNIYINTDALRKLRRAAEEGPVVLLPNHRSYLDFLLISYIFFTYDVPLPVIASGLALARMKFMGEWLRRCGAFYIRRSIASDGLYSTVLSEYVRSLTRFAPVEFYIEGFRSRSLKSLKPKLGMLRMVLDPYFEGEVHDVTLVPVSLSYDRLVEESLLARELLGIPKPKESTAGLLKAAGVLRQDYGRAHVYFGRPVSARRLFGGEAEPLVDVRLPGSPLEEEEEKKRAGVNVLAHVMVGNQERGCFVSPWSLMSHVLLRRPPSLLSRTGLPWSRLAEETLWLKRLALRFGARLNWPGDVPDGEVMSSAVALHRTSVRLEGERVFLVADEGLATATLMMASYRNQSLHVFTRPALLAAARSLAGSGRRGETFAYFRFLRDLFGSEFIFVPGKAAEDFEEARSLLEKCGALDIVVDREARSSRDAAEVLSFLRALFQPFVDSYSVALRFLGERDAITEKDFLAAARSLVGELIASGRLRTYEALSSDVLKNVLSGLRGMAALTKSEASEKEYTVDRDAVTRIQRILCKKNKTGAPCIDFHLFSRSVFKG